MLYRESVGNSDDHVEYRKVKLSRGSVEHRKERVLYYSKVQYGRHSEYNGNIAYREKHRMQHTRILDRNLLFISRTNETT